MSSELLEEGLLAAGELVGKKVPAVEHGRKPGWPDEDLVLDPESVKPSISSLETTGRDEEWSEVPPLTVADLP